MSAPNDQKDRLNDLYRQIRYEAWADIRIFSSRIWEILSMSVAGIALLIALFSIAAATNVFLFSPAFAIFGIVFFTFRHVFQSIEKSITNRIELLKELDAHDSNVPSNDESVENPITTYECVRRVGWPSVNTIVFLFESLYWTTLVIWIVLLIAVLVTVPFAWVIILLGAFPAAIIFGLISYTLLKSDETIAPTIANTFGQKIKGTAASLKSLRLKRKSSQQDS